MIERDKVKILLKIHGIDTSAPGDAIRSVLQNAGYGQEEINQTIITLRDIPDDKLVRASALHKLFHTDLSLKPDEVHALLGIDIEIRKVDVNKQKNQSISLYQSVLLVIIAFFLAFSGIAFSMYSSQIGPFHSEASYSAR